MDAGRLPWTAVALAGALAAAGRQDGAGAEELLGKVREKLAKVPALSVRFRASGDFFGEFHSGTLKIKGEKYACDYFSRASGEKWVERFDGTRRAVLFEGGKAEARPPLPGFAAYLRAAAGLGSVGESYTEVLHARGLAKAPDPAEAFKVSDVKDGGEQTLGTRKTRVVTYRLTSPGAAGEKPKVLAVKAWIDPEALVSVRREITLPGDTKLTETYADVSAGEVPDAEFAVP